MGVIYGLILTLVFPANTMTAPDIVQGFNVLWQPSLIIMLQTIWIIVFVYTGRSQVTGSQISFHVIKDRI
jgi:hypothetical protein